MIKKTFVKRKEGAINGDKTSMPNSASEPLNTAMLADGICLISTIEAADRREAALFQPTEIGLLP